MPPADLAYWMGKFVLEVRKKDGQEYLPKYIYVLVCCFKRYYEQHVVFDVNPLSSSDSRFGNFRVTLDSEMKIKREKENDPDSDSVICLALYIHYQLFSLENSCCCICAGQTNVLSHDSCSFCNSYNVESCCCVYLQLEKCALSGYCALKCALS